MDHEIRRLLVFFWSGQYAPVCKPFHDQETLPLTFWDLSKTSSQLGFEYFEVDGDGGFVFSL
jgi:hypothetical protein